MKYLYYSLYQFYFRIIRVQNHYRPIINVTGSIAVLEMFLIFSILNSFLYLYSGVEIVPYSPIVPTIVFVCLYWLNYKYFIRKERLILSQVKSELNKAQIILVHVLVFILVLVLIWMYVFDGIFYFLFDEFRG